jgi:hypothetical protein
MVGRLQSIEAHMLNNLSFAEVDLFHQVSRALKTFCPNVRLHGASARPADFVIEGDVDPTEPLRDEGLFGDYSGCFSDRGRPRSSSSPLPAWTSAKQGATGRQPHEPQ